MKKWMKPLPDPETLRQHLLVLAVLDVILCPEEWLRVHRYEPNWTANTSLGIIDNGAGDDLYIVFALEGTIIKGFDHESPLSPHAADEYGVGQGMYEETPPELLTYLDDHRFDKEDVTFCLWWKKGDSEWKTDDIENPQEFNDGSDYLLGYIEYTPENYVDWAEAYYDIPVQLEAVRLVYGGTAISAEIIACLNPGRDVQAAITELARLGIRVADNDI
ncbi:MULTISPECIES: hypothetical protein [Paenibacillus]|uniref:hypothetical protein n=1 Tax=Paenibacillus TaxID=44249 RepID=UPI0022B91890|nr:hypothetical protein [Paenibacillus caseinilyticus]MCZ8523980.1 hypothetical protein [Paenibacillus caseinilyticus]